MLTQSEKEKLESLARKYTSAYYRVIRAKIVLMAAHGIDNDEIGRRLNLPRQIVSKWRERFFERRFEGLEDEPRKGRPPVFSPRVVVEIKALACELPYENDIPLSRFSTNEVAREAIKRGIVAKISGATIWRWLNEDAIKPQQHRSWIFPRDPGFQEKAGRVLDLYHGIWGGQPLESDEYVICADEKSSIQARLRIHATEPPRSGECMRVEHEYERCGALSYLAAWDVKRAKVFGRCELLKQELNLLAVL